MRRKKPAEEKLPDNSKLPTSNVIHLFVQSPEALVESIEKATSDMRSNRNDHFSFTTGFGEVVNFNFKNP
jgi:hypothetical protein